MRRQSKFFKWLIVFSSLGGVLWSLFSARREGYSRWWKRLLYFTAQSNIWIGLTTLALLVVPLNKRGKERVYLLKYLYTVSITVTGLVFCFLLAPFAPEGYRPWTVCNVMTHVVSPVVSLADFFWDDYRFSLKKGSAFLALLPPLFYVLPTSVLVLKNVDFGRGVPYPYFFMNYRSSVGLFGVFGERPFVLGAFYWFALFLLLILGLAFIFQALLKKKEKNAASFQTALKLLNMVAHAYANNKGKNDYIFS